MQAEDLRPGDTIIIDGRTRIIRNVRRIAGDVGLTFHYEGPYIGNLPRNNSEEYLNNQGFTLRARGRVAA